MSVSRTVDETTIYAVNLYTECYAVVGPLWYVLFSDKYLLFIVKIVIFVGESTMPDDVQLDLHSVINNVVYANQCYF